MPSVLEPLHRWAEKTPDKLLYAWLNVDGDITRRYTYRDFLARTVDIAHHLHHQHPLSPGERVLLAYPPGLEVICAFFACVRLGLVPVPVYPPTRHGFQAAMTKMAFIAQDCGAAAVLTDRAYYWSMKVNRVRHRIKTFSWSSDVVSRLPWIVSDEAPRIHRPSLSDRHTDLLFLQYTSGSTADPRGVMVTHDNLLINGDAVVDHLPVGVSWLPQYHDMGLIGYYLFFAMKGGTTYGFSPMDFIRRPALWLETISRYRGTASSAPNFAYAYCLRPGKLPPSTFAELDLTSLRFLMTAAEPVRPRVFRAFLQTFEPYGLDPKSFFSAYGLAEYTLAVSNYGRAIKRFARTDLQNHVVRSAAPSAPEGEGVSLVSCGRPLGETEVCIVDPETHQPLDADLVGEIWIRGPSRCAGYWNRPALTREMFHAPLPDGSTWLRTGDLGFVVDQELYLCGRRKDVIIVRGQNHYPQDIELLVEQAPEVRNGCVAAFSLDGDAQETVIVAAEVRSPTRLPDSRQIQADVQQLLGISIDAFVWIRARTIPKTSSGKIVRHRARAAYVAGKLDVIAVHQPIDADAREPAAAPAPIEAPGVAAVFGRFGLTGQETWTLPEAGLDSIQLVDFAHALKAHLQEQGDAELAGAVDLQVLQTIALCELSALLVQLEQSAPHARLRFRQMLGRLGAAHRRREREMMRRDAVLRFDPVHLPKVKGLANDLRGAILLTGATGFFGPFLLASLLQQTDADIVVLVRAEDEAAAMQRVLSGLGEVSAAGWPLDAWATRIHPVCGDLSRVNLGLTTHRWAALAEQIGTIYHNGAWVNYLYDYVTLRDVNVGGTNEIVRLAMSHRPKVFNHISTTFVFGWSVKEILFEHDTNQNMDLLDFGYSQSKWVSEQVVVDAMRKGLQARIFRPALITPSISGRGSHFDISVRLLAFMLNHGLGTTARNQVSFSPADVTADNIVAIAEVPESVGKTFHVTRDAYAHMEEITNILGELTGASFTQLPLKAFVPAVIARCLPGDILFPLLDFFVRSTDNITAMEFKRYDNETYRRFRDASPNGRIDPPLEAVVLGLLRFMRRKGIIHASVQER